MQAAIIYDHFTPLALPQLEEFGFCGRGEAKDFIKDGNIELGGRLPINTNGGQLGEAYIHGMNGIAEGVRLIRGTSTNQPRERGARAGDRGDDGAHERAGARQGGVANEPATATILVLLLRRLTVKDSLGRHCLSIECKHLRDVVCQHDCSFGHAPPEKTCRIRHFVQEANVLPPRSRPSTAGFHGSPFLAPSPTQPHST